MNEVAFRVVQQLTGQAAPVPATDQEPGYRARAGKLGGLKGGKARAEKLTPEQRSEIAKKAAASRWANKHDAE